MKTSSTRNSRSVVGMIMMGLFFAAMIGNMDVAPAFGKDKHDKMENHDRGGNEHRRRGYERDRYMHDRRAYRPYGYGYRERGYTPPPVIYVPPPPLGIGIFFPPIFLPPIIIHR
jgi:hypothetical protein